MAHQGEILSLLILLYLKCTRRVLFNCYTQHESSTAQYHAQCVHGRMHTSFSTHGVRSHTGREGLDARFSSFITWPLFCNTPGCIAIELRVVLLLSLASLPLLNFSPHVRGPPVTAGRMAASPPSTPPRFLISSSPRQPIEGQKPCATELHSSTATATTVAKSVLSRRSRAMRAVDMRCTGPSTLSN